MSKTFASEKRKSARSWVVGYCACAQSTIENGASMAADASTGRLGWHATHSTGSRCCAASFPPAALASFFVAAAAAEAGGRRRATTFAETTPQNTTAPSSEPHTMCWSECSVEKAEETQNLLLTYSEGEVYVFRQWLRGTSSGSAKGKKGGGGETPGSYFHSPPCSAALGPATHAHARPPLRSKLVCLTLCAGSPTTATCGRGSWRECICRLEKIERTN